LEVSLVTSASRCSFFQILYICRTFGESNFVCYEIAGYLFSQNHARLVVLMATIYAIYCVKVRVGWHGVFLSINLTFFSNDILNFLLQWCDNVRESTQFEEHKETETVLEDEFSAECEFSIPADESEKVQSCKSSSKPTASSSVVNNQKESSARKVVVEEETSSADEMKRILDSGGHYEALGFPRHKRIDVAILKKEYRKKVSSTFVLNSNTSNHFN